MKKIALLISIYIGISMQCQKTQATNYNDSPPAPAYTKDYPSPYERNKMKAAENSSIPAYIPKDVIKNMDLRDVVFQPSLSPEFPGGINNFRMKVYQNFDTSAYGKTEHVAQANIFLIINQKGSISDIYVAGEEPEFNNLVKAAVEKTKTSWKPAMNNQVNVKTLIRFSFGMNF